MPSRVAEWRIVQQLGFIFIEIGTHKGRCYLLLCAMCNKNYYFNKMGGLAIAEGILEKWYLNAMFS